MLTVTSNIPTRRVGFLATVSEGTLANNPGTPPQDANKACAFGLGPKTISFKVWCMGWHMVVVNSCVRIEPAWLGIQFSCPSPLSSQLLFEA